MKNREKIAFLCDFDGTVCPTQMMDFLYTQFAEAGMAYAERWERGELSTQEEIELSFATIHASREEMESALDRITIDPHFRPFLEACRRGNHSFGIVSDGLEWYIKYILERHGIHDVSIFANRIYFEPDGFRFEYPWYDDETPLRGVCKPMIVRQHQEKGAKVVYVGDGMSDFDVVGVADHLFATGLLAEYAQGKGSPVITFSDCADLMPKFREMQLIE
jgi:2,3-diketo-5-methylthio-1-phosphopentane phosphatase